MEHGRPGLEDLRVRQGMSRKDLAQELSVSENTIYRIESNASYPVAHKYMVRLAILFSLSTDDVDRVIEGDVLGEIGEGPLARPWQVPVDLLSFRAGPSIFGAGMSAISQ